uniref:Uncharacterized protein n=1 Tax=Chromera velia CCMP2878 TaxID=1169474 RepID=A0A0G4I632_9ALVE|eukprot:Cvel_11289.t1-p1 / transcript=Cvel_11289.t1 / gene=Cvel_11289 / organism=Chromera_velia_CCMP2878 / gene_product=hypothetical protein / transcript_product=hypothetical protein / location=Cvel_scaffold704:67046-67510(+) / protein_length=155 / sequence_SO=supercontig / SO=protein_coding / is_pseudo=false
MEGVLNLVATRLKREEGPLYPPTDFAAAARRAREKALKAVASTLLREEPSRESGEEGDAHSGGGPRERVGGEDSDARGEAGLSWREWALSFVSLLGGRFWGGGQGAAWHQKVSELAKEKEDRDKERSDASDNEEEGDETGEIEEEGERREERRRH